MIYDTLENYGLYCGAHKNFKRAFEFIKEAVEKDFSAGRYELNGEELFASVQEYTTKPESEGAFEGHEKYIDIQYIVAGEERIDVTPIGDAVISKPYDPEKDIAFYGDVTAAARLILKPNAYAIFFPADIHKPGLAASAQQSVKKIVVKVKI